MVTFLFMVLLICGQLGIVPAASNSRTNERLKHSYLGFPRLHFTGYFHSDPMTANNRLINHNMTRNRGPRIQADSEGFNSVGTGNFMFYNAYVSGVCYMDGTCTSQDDEILGQSVEDWFDRAPAKLVDISPTCDTLSNIHGMKLQVGQIIRAALTPTPVQQMWLRCIETPNLSTFSAGAQFKSVLTNLTWLDRDPDFESRFLDELRETNPLALAVKFNLDQYDSRVASDKFRLGRLVGTIGPHHPNDSIPFMRFTRQLQAGDSECTGPFCHAPFSIDHAMNLLTIDVGNSFRSSFNGSFNTQTLGRLYVGFQPALGESSEVDCNSQVVYAGEINYTTEYWYERTAGVVTLNLTETLSGKAIKEQLHVSPLVIFKYKKENGTLVCQKPVLVERHHGLTVGAMITNTYRKEPGEAWSFHLFASKFGVPQPGVELSLNYGGEHCPMQICGPCTTGFSTPQSALSFPPFVVTDEGGFANIPLMAYDPMEGAPYPHVVELQGSQLYLLFINMSFGGISDAALFHFGARVFQIYHVPDTPTWYDHVLPTLEPYHNLFPVMRSFVHLTDYHSVLENKDKMKAVLSLPIDDPHHMPTTRDLSKRKRKMLLDWLENPILGQPAPSIENLRTLLQQAMELELSTIPPYLTALMSIKEGFNVEIGRRIKSVVVQEMLHMALVGNLLNAVGGSPSIASTLNAPLYPSKLPGGVRPDLVVSLQKLKPRVH
ncbi:uncharacterized protein LOC106173762 [Lingula anatina]|uniref:Uncharacterized protein LOC106173762 n=1 Tax=Lingula anatina TaxID=7574 RepID=A0A1S3JJ99_LINAN|nr:uncharacterized protein LOC106173762 [Lingula anatina]|eukprot:XP_013410453.1 uncharacterized protein LOC106173762 [Lingula anatina]